MSINFIKKYEYLILLLGLSIIFLVRMIELSTVGETWDEYPKVRNGQLHIKAITSLDFSKETWQEHEKHPPLGKIILAIPTYIQKSLNINPFNDNVYNEGKRYFLARTTSLLFSIGTLFLTYLIAKKAFNKKAAIFSTIFLSLMPHFVAHSFVATLEGIQAFFSMLLIYTLLNAKKLSYNNSIILGIILGLLFLVKLSSFFFILYVLYYIILFFNKEKKLDVIKAVLVINIVALLIFVALWPWLWSNPILRLVESIDSITRDARTEVFLGGYNTLPWYYFIFYFIITTPILYLFIFASGLISLVKTNLFKDRYFAFILVCFLSIFLFSFSGFKQNGVRYLYSSFPVFCIVLGVFITKFINYLKKPIYTKLTIFIILVIAVLPFFQISPYYFDYYNEFVGGPENVYKNKTAQVDWWGEGSKEAILWVNSNLPKNSRICVNIIPNHVVPVFREDIKVDKDCVYDKDYLIYNTMYKLQERFNVESKHTLIYELKANGAPLVLIYKVTKD